MGKPKGKSPKPVTIDSPHELLTEYPSAPRSGAPLKAADGHNVDGWADEDIRTYNELLNERAKLEKEKNELEQKSSRHQAQRALLDENATALDRLFKAQLGGDFKFTGSSTCCLDAHHDPPNTKRAVGTNVSCKHEICMRARTKGVSWMEMDTIKYYHARIVSEKSQRMQNALRKQRDVELVRVKKDDDEELALRARKNALLDRATRGGAGLDGSKAPANKPEKVTSLESSTLDMLASKDFLLDPKNSAILEAAKENEHIVRRIRGRLDKIRNDVNAGRVSAVDARVKLDQANSEMAEAERKNNEFRQMIIDAEPAISQLHPPATTSVNANIGSSIGASAANVPCDWSNLPPILPNALASNNAEAFSQALSVMKGFFSASDPHDVQNAITDLRGVLELSGPMSPVLQKSFKALEDMLAKPNAKGFTLDVTTGDGVTRTCNNVVDVMMNLRSKMQSSTNPSAVTDPDFKLDSDTIKANIECIKVEDAAKKDMEKMAEKMSEDTVENVTTALKKVKAKAILKSPIPPLSDIILDDVINEILLHRSVKALIVEAAAGTGLAQLSGKITSLVISTARNKPERYLAILDRVKAFIKKVQQKEGLQTLLEAVTKVDASMAKFVAAHEEKQRKILAATGKSLSTVPSLNPDTSSVSLARLTSTKYLLEGALVDPESFELYKKFFETTSPVNDRLSVTSRMLSHYHMNLEEGIWNMFQVFVSHRTSAKFWFGDWKFQKDFYCANMRIAAAVRDDKFLDTVLAYQQRGVCPGMTALVMAQRLTYQIRENFESAKSKAMILRNIFANYEPDNNREWVHSFHFIAQAMADLFAMIVVQVSAPDSRYVPILAADILSVLCTFVLGVADPNKAETNLRAAEAFTTSFLTQPENGEFGKLQDVFSRFAYTCQDSRYRCSPQHTCKDNILLFNQERLRTLVPEPLKVNKKGKENSAESVSTYPPQAETAFGLPRHTHLRTMVDAYWEVARSIMPHLDCFPREKKCFCSSADQEFAEEIQVVKHVLDADFEELKSQVKKGMEPPKSLWDRLEKNATILHERPVNWGGNQKKIAEIRTEELRSGDQGSRMPSNSGRRIKIKQVPVSVPSIQTNKSSNTLQAGNVGKEFADDLSSKGIVSAKDANPPMTERELFIRNQLLTFVDSVDHVHKFASYIGPLLRRSPLEGVVLQVDDMLNGHVVMAWAIAEAQGYTALQNWMDDYFGEYFGSRRLSLNGGAQGTSNGAKLPSISTLQKQNPQTRVHKHTANATPATPSLEQKAEQPVNDIEHLGQEFLRQMDVVSERRKRHPQRRR